MMRSTLLLLALVAVAFGQAVPSITNVTNAAIPSLDNPPNSIHLPPRSMATIFGTNLADAIISATPPWTTTLGGTEVHLADDTCFSSSCDLVGSLVYVSPTQINFVVPDNGSTACKNCTPTAYRVVLMRGGQRMDNRSYILGGPGRLIIDPYYIADYNVVFQVGYDCLDSYSVTDPGSCGLSWSQGQHRVPVGAITDALLGTLISPQAPVHQGQLITLWMTGLFGGVTPDAATGLLQQANPVPFGFGIAQFGTDIAATVGNGSQGPYGTFTTPKPVWAGESPQFVGLDQVNVAFPTCTNQPAATEKRYDAFLMYTSVETGTTIRIYLPFLVRPGDPDCRWILNTTTTLTSSLNPSVAGQPLTLTATVSPSAATGGVTFFDGNQQLGTSTLNSGKAICGGTTTCSTSSIGPGTHSIKAVYNGDGQYGASTSAALIQNVKAATTTTVTSSVNPSSAGQTVSFTATVLPSTATGTISFFDTGTTLPCGSVLSGGKSTCGISAGLNAGNHAIEAAYTGDSTYASSSGVLTQVVTKVNTNTGLTATPVTSSMGAVPGVTGTPVLGYVAVYIAVSPTTSGIGNYCGSGDTSLLDNGSVIDKRSPPISYRVFGPGPHSLTATYSGNDSCDASTSSAVLLTGTSTIVTASLNPAPLGQTVVFAATVSPSSATGKVTFDADGFPIFTCSDAPFGIANITNGQARCTTPTGPGYNALQPGTHSITAVYMGIGSNSGMVSGSTSPVLPEIVNGH